MSNISVNANGITEESCIKSIDDVEAFATYLINDLGVNFHPDNDVSDYVNYSTGEPTFSDKEVSIGNGMIGECFNVSKKENVAYPLTELGWDYNAAINPILFHRGIFEDSLIHSFSP